MAHRLIFDPSIPNDLANALDHYEMISPILANRFREVIDRRLDQIAENPESFAVDVSPIRFARVERFPYLIFFVPKDSFVSIVAIVHASSNPERWRKRT